MSSRRPFKPQSIALVCVVAALTMVGAAFAAVPFYRAFCQATGFDGTPLRATAQVGNTAPGGLSDRTISVRFDTNTRDLPWEFSAQQNAQTIKLGRTNLAYFTVKNDGDTAVTGRAAYNISPERAARYFVKLQCFCFSDQTIAAHTAVTFPVVYYVNAKFADDPDTKVLSEVTLSYTFYPAPDQPKPASHRKA